MVSGTISNERTFVEASGTAHEVLSGLCERVGARMRSRGVLAGQLTLKLRYTDFHTLTRTRAITPTSDDFELHKIVLDLYRESRTRTLSIRLLGLQVAKVRLAEAQLVLFDSDQRRGDAVDEIRDRFGYHASRVVDLATQTPAVAHRRTLRSRLD